MFLLAPVAAAQQVDQAFVARMGDLPETLRIEAALADALETNDEEKLQALARSISEEDRAAIARFLTVATEAASNPDKIGEDTEASKIALLLGPCHYAGLTIRVITLRLSEGSLKSSRSDGVFRISPGDLDDLFAENAVRCETIKGLARSIRRIGSACAMDGTCGGQD
ncbi:hypothetical protein [Tabrizicola sp.]|uniref:hypothetical protein n=1 Tax=Tabrizicola sp. TaxID=2005166 RepID=UPI003F667D67